jgi:hypothetical protein
MPLVLNGTTGVQDNSGAFVAGTAVASTSGTSIDFTSIPSWVKRVTVMFRSVSTNGSSNLLLQLGSGSVTTSGYISGCQTFTVATTSTAGMLLTGINGAAHSQNITATLTLVTGNTWLSVNSGYVQSYDALSVGSGNIALSGVLDRVRITTVNGTDTFDAGSINILYE